MTENFDKGQAPTERSYENDAIKQTYEMIINASGRELTALVKDFMRPDPDVIHMEATLKDAIRVIVETKIDGVPIVDDHSSIVGMITKTLVLREIHSNTDINTKISEIMKPNPLVTTPDKNLLPLIKFSIGSMPVVEDGKVIGLITLSETTKAFFTSYLRLQQELRTVIDSTHSGIIAVNEKGDINLMNPAAERILGASIKDVIELPLSRFLPDPELKKICTSGESAQGIKLRYKDRNLIININPLKNRDQHTGMVIVVQDISDFENISLELKTTQKLKNQMDRIFEMSFDGIFITDNFGKILRVNPALLRILEVTENAILDKSTDELFANGLFEKPLPMEKILTGSPVTTYLEINPGKTVLITSSPVVNTAGSISLIVYNVRDITELNNLKSSLEKEARISKHYKDELSKFKSLNNYIFKSKSSQSLIDTVLRIAQVDVTVLIQGESGVGKEVIAEILHENSSRKDKLMMSLNCAAIPDNLLESELFGYESGAFSGASKDGKTGLFELADGGTLFLDEIADIPLALQSKLLRALEKQEIMKIGGGKPRSINVRIIAAANRNLQEMVEEKTFRKDLFYRLNVVPILIPPLRQRKDEIPDLINHFTKEFNDKYGFKKQFSESVFKYFLDYHWPGNIRELKNFIERTMITTPENHIKAMGDISSMNIYINESPGEEILETAGELNLKSALERLEKEMIRDALERFRTTREAARKIGISQPSLIRKAAKYSIQTRKAGR